MSTPVLATKLYAPARRPHLVGRARLTQQLDSGLEPGRCLTVVSAPPGFGKTTLLGDWLQHLAEAPSPVAAAWLSLDDGDNDLPRFLAHLVAALRGAGLKIGERAADAAQAAMADALVSLVNDLAAGATPVAGGWVLVLDDYHVITQREVHEAVGFLLDHLPEQLHVVVATRSDPPLSLARLRSRGQLTELRAADLRFTPQEAHEFLTRTMGLDLEQADVEALGERTEGWVAGLQLAGLSLRAVERSGISAFIADFTGSNRFVIDYLADEVLARQPGELRGFLLRTSVLEGFTGPLCDAVTDGSDSARLLAELERDNLFVVPLDDRRACYRYHHLFADVLRARLLAEHPDEVLALHGRAAHWYAEQGQAVDAVRHALAAEDHDFAARLIEEALPQMRRARQDSVLASWAAALPATVVQRSPVLSTLAAWSRLMAGDLDTAATHLDDAEAALAAGAADATVRQGWAQTEDLRTAPAAIAVYRASLAQAHGDVSATVEHAQRAVDLAGPHDHFVRGAGSGFLGLAAWAAGDVHRAIETFTAAVGSLHAAGNLVDELDTTIVLSDMWLAAGRPVRARRLLEEALRTATQDGRFQPRAAPDLHVGLADLDRERGDLPSAEAHLEAARVLSERASITENRHRWSVVMAGVLTARGRHDAALELLDRAESVYRPGFYPDVRPIAATKARVRIAAGDLDGAAVWVEGRAIGLDDDADYLREYEHLTLVRLLLARGDAGAARVLPLLERLAEAAVDAGRYGSVVEIRMLQALARHLAGDVPGALEALAAGFDATPDPECYSRIYLDEGAPTLDLLRHAATGPAAEHARRLLGGAVVPQARAAATQGLADPLSAREQQVLRMLESELTGPQIARELYVTLNTLRTHTKRIFTKLDVTTRAAAVRRAKEHGLL